MQECRCQITNGSLVNLNLIKSKGKTVVFILEKGLILMISLCFLKARNAKVTFAGKHKSK